MNMMTRSENYDVRCMLCGAEVGQILSGKFRKHANCAAPMPRKAGMVRCCHCGGSLYLDPIDVYPALIDRAQVARARAEDAA
jgi:hypothetical protein